MAKKYAPRLLGYSPFRELVGATFTRVEDGYSECVLDVTEKLFNPYGTLHGGAVFTLADAGMGAALYAGVEEDEICTTIETKVVFFRPVKSGKLTCASKVIHRGGTIAATESEIRLGSELVAKALGTFSIRKEREDKDRKP